MNGDLKMNGEKITNGVATVCNGSNGIHHQTKLRILFSPVFAIGHVNACIGLAKPLLKRGHRVAFFLDHTFQGKLSKLGFEEFIFKSKFNAEHKDSAQHLADLLISHNVLGDVDPLERLKNIVKLFFNNESVFNSIRESNQAMEKVIQQFQPDIILVDNSVLWPSIYHYGAPWINVISTVPLYHFCENNDLPPAWTGLSINSDKSKWPVFCEELKKFLYSKEINDIFQELGYPRYENDICCPKTQSLTVYAFPEEYNYEKIRKLDKWFNIEVFNKNKEREIIQLKDYLPKEFFEDDLDGKWSGKWIYISMGSMGSADLDLMKRILSPLVNTPHKYIVSKGPRHQEYELPGKNMWGDRFLPQKELLPQMDLVLTHGGNNSVTETFAQGVPMIVFPLFADQPDNGTRMQETGWAAKLEPYKFTEQELLDTVERMLNDQELKIKLQNAGKRIRQSNKHEQFADLVEEIAEDYINKKKQNQKSYRILAMPVLATGHINANIGLSLPLLKRGHRVAFFVDQSYQGELKKHGFEEFTYETSFTSETKNAQDSWAKLLLERKILGEKDPYIQALRFKEMFGTNDVIFKEMPEINKSLMNVIEQFKPDLILIDQPFLYPCIEKSGIPWINVLSPVPLFHLNIEELPPPTSGLSINSDKSLWKKFRELLPTLKTNKGFNDLLEEMGYERYPNDGHYPKTESLNVYAFPEEYNFEQIRKLDKWFNIEVFNKNEERKIILLKDYLPRKFFEDDLNGKWSGKWIYVSMGSMGGADLDLMKRILTPLVNTPHKYIVSKGPRYQEYELPGKNMWGDRFLPQKELLPQMDLVLTHGGNNTVTETFAQGVPMIIFPLFGDQLDNGQRLHETGYAIKLEPYNFTEQQLLDAIEKSLNDQKLRRKLEEAGERIRNGNQHEKFVNLVEKIIEDHEKICRIIMLPLIATGHVNANIGLGLFLLKRGHRVAFFIDQTYRGEMKKLGFEEFVYESLFNSNTKNTQDNWAKILLDLKILGEPDTYLQGLRFREMSKNSKENFMLKEIPRINETLIKVIQDFKPDLFMLDSSMLYPCIHQAGIPWINVSSVVPLFHFLDNEELPPSMSGFSINSDKSTWPKFKKLAKEMLQNKDANDLFEQMGYERYPDDAIALQTQSLNIYAFPEEYNYEQIRNADKWFNVEVFNKNEGREIIQLKDYLPKEFFEDDLDGKWSGKWIYVLMGSMGSADLDLMKRILTPLANTPHKYIVSKGPRYQEYELPGKNMWGDRFLPQKELLPQMDLVLTHGGNNTVTETFAQGVPMIVFPLFGDQHDNGQRLHETGYAIKLEPYNFTEQQLLDAIEKIFNDQELKIKLKKAGERIRNGKQHEKLVDLIEKIVHDQRNQKC